MFFRRACQFFKIFRHALARFSFAPPSWGQKPSFVSSPQQYTTAPWEVYSSSGRSFIRDWFSDFHPHGLCECDVHHCYYAVVSSDAGIRRKVRWQIWGYWNPSDWLASIQTKYCLRLIPWAPVVYKAPSNVSLDPSHTQSQQVRCALLIFSFGSCVDRLRHTLEVVGRHILLCVTTLFNNRDKAQWDGVTDSDWFSQKTDLLINLTCHSNMKNYSELTKEVCSRRFIKP